MNRIRTLTRYVKNFSYIDGEVEKMVTYVRNDLKDSNPWEVKSIQVVPAHDGFIIVATLKR